jgi:hypothetical protein
MEIIFGHWMESISRFLFSKTPEGRVSRVSRVHEKKPSEINTVIIKEPTRSSNRRGPDDYTPINLRHDFDREWVEEWSNVVDIEKYE